jgi:hypothetical protein
MEVILGEVILLVSEKQDGKLVTLYSYILSFSSWLWTFFLHFFSFF